jgi:hypothetical protein
LWVGAELGNVLNDKSVGLVVGFDFVLVTIAQPDRELETKAGKWHVPKSIYRCIKVSSSQPLLVISATGIGINFGHDGSTATLIVTLLICIIVVNVIVVSGQQMQMAVVAEIDS